jgi:hypothetical protein
MPNKGGKRYLLTGVRKATSDRGTNVRFWFGAGAANPVRKMAMIYDDEAQAAEVCATWNRNCTWIQFYVEEVTDE